MGFERAEEIAVQLKEVGCDIIAVSGTPPFLLKGLEFERQWGDEHPVRVDGRAEGYGLREKGCTNHIPAVEPAWGSLRPGHRSGLDCQPGPAPLVSSVSRIMRWL